MNDIFVQIYTHDIPKSSKTNSPNNKFSNTYSKATLSKEKIKQENIKHCRKKVWFRRDHLA